MFAEDRSQRGLRQLARRHEEILSLNDRVWIDNPEEVRREGKCILLQPREYRLLEETDAPFTVTGSSETASNRHGDET